MYRKCLETEKSGKSDLNQDFRACGEICDR